MVKQGIHGGGPVKKTLYTGGRSTHRLQRRNLEALLGWICIVSGKLELSRSRDLQWQYKGLLFLLW